MSKLSEIRELIVDVGYIVVVIILYPYYFTRLILFIYYYSMLQRLWENERFEKERMSRG